MKGWKRCNFSFGSGDINVEKDDNEPCTKEVHEHLFIEDEKIEQQDNENYLDTNDPKPIEP